jgi:hypothetical protein
MQVVASMRVYAYMCVVRGARRGIDGSWMDAAYVETARSPWLGIHT